MTLEEIGKWLYERRGTAMLQVRHRAGQYQVVVRRKANGAHTREIVASVRGDEIVETIRQGLQANEVLYQADKEERAEAEPSTP